MQALLASPALSGGCSPLQAHCFSSQSSGTHNPSCQQLAPPWTSELVPRGSEAWRSRRSSSSSLSTAFVGAPLRGCTLRNGTVEKTESRTAVIPRASLVEILPKEYGYVVLVAAASAILTQWQTIEVARQRAKAGLKLPKLYEDKEDSLFNCYQRAHQNTLESYPAFLSLLLLTGLGFPKTSTVLGAMWVVGRVFYTLGYYTGEPRNRFRGMWGQLALYGLIITAGVFGVKQLL